MGTWQRIMLIVCALVAALSLLWIASEQRFQSCVEQAVAKAQGPPSLGYGAEDVGSGFTESPNVKDCSRLPF